MSFAEHFAFGASRVLLEILPKKIVFKAPVRALGDKDSTSARQLGSLAGTAVNIATGCY